MKIWIVRSLFQTALYSYRHRSKETDDLLGAALSTLLIVGWFVICFGVALLVVQALLR